MKGSRNQLGRLLFPGDLEGRHFPWISPRWLMSRLVEPSAWRHCRNWFVVGAIGVVFWWMGSGLASPPASHCWNPYPSCCRCPCNCWIRWRRSSPIRSCYCRIPRAFLYLGAQKIYQFSYTKRFLLFCFDKCDQMLVNA